MNEISFTVTAFEQGGLTTGGEPSTSSIVVRSDMIEIPSGIQKVTSVPEIWKKKWNSTDETYEITQSTSSSISNTIYFYKKNGETFECLGYLSAKNVEVDFMTTRILGATHIRFTAGIGSSTIRPDDSTETKKYYYFIHSINVNGTILKWYYNNDRLTHDDMLSAPEKAMKKPYPKALWRTNTGIPYHELFPVPKAAHADPVPQYRYITVHDMRTEQNNFDNNGLAVLDPISCTVTENFNASWTVTLEHPIDTAEKWKYLVEFNILKVLGQLFIIKKVDHSWTGNSGKVTAYAEHVFYQLNDPYIKKGTNISGSTGQQIIFNALENATYELRENDIYYRFQSNSDLTDENADVSYENIENIAKSKWNPVQNSMTPIDFLLGSDGFTANFGGDLYRDNFYFSLNKVMENGIKDSFDIRIGMNLKGITRTVDTSQLCTHFTAYDKFGAAFSCFWEVHGSIPHHIVRSQEFSFGESYTKANLALLGHEAGKYFGRHWKPLISYSVSLEDTVNNPDYKEFANHPRYNVGDRGRIFDERLNISIDAFVSGTVKDGITGKTLEIKFSNQNEFLRGGDYDISITDPPEPPPPDIPEEDNENGGVTEK